MRIQADSDGHIDNQPLFILEYVVSLIVSWIVRNNVQPLPIHLLKKKEFIKLSLEDCKINRSLFSFSP